MRKDIAFQSYLEDFMRIAYPDAPVNEDDYYLVYAKTSVPDDAILPYLVYEFVDADFLDGDVSIEIDLWDRTESEAEMNRVAREFRHYINDKDLEGVPYYKGNNIVIEKLENAKALLAKHDIQHSYPHCWRCKKPVIYRATPQWFVKVEKFRDAALEAIVNSAGGIPRVINKICNTSLLIGNAQGLNTISAETVMRAVEDCNFR